MPRLFVAVWPPDDVLDAVAGIARPDISGLRWTTRDQWHVTVRFLGSVDAVDVVVGALGALESAPTTAVMGPHTDRFGRRVLHVPVAGLDQIAAEVVARTASIGQPPDDRPFHGHLTLARARDRRGVDLRPLCGEPLAGEWRARSVCVVRSDLGRAGAHYHVEAEVPLEGP